MNITFDLPSTLPPIRQGHLKMGGTSKSGNSLQVTNRYLLYNNTPWIPVMGEFQYSRYDRSQWETELLKMKAGGVQIVASYLIWIHHEEQEGVFCFEDDRDVRYFVELCKKHGLYFMARLGPWVHGEVRNGGFPDWILNQRVRTDDPEYLVYVERLYQVYYEQLKGLLFSDDGPVIGIQLENELVDNPEHLLRLKEMAVDIGFCVPLYTVTAWAVSGIAKFPKYEVLPVFGAYPEAPWRENTDPFERKPSFLFVPGRNDITIGSDLIKGFSASSTEDELEDYPYAYCEIGPGVQVTYHRRPVIKPYDLYSITMITLAKGNNLPGYYVYHGGRNPKGPLGLYQESRATGYLNDLPVISYDFQAPIGEYGFIKQSYHYYRLLHLFLEAYGSHMAVCETQYPDIAPKDRKDTFTPRCAFRVDADGSGYLFFNTNQRNEYIDPIRKAQILVKFGDNRQCIPLKAMDIPEQTSCFFPVNQKIGNRTLKYALAQPITKLEYEGEQYYFYAAVDGIPAEFLFEGELHDLTVSGNKTVVNEGTFISDVAPGFKPAITYEEDGTRIHLILLKFMDALRLYRTEKAGQAYVFLSEGAMHFEEEALVLCGTAEEHEFEFEVFPPMKYKALSPMGKHGMFTAFHIPLKPCSVQVRLEETKTEISPDNPYIPYLFEEDLDKTKEYLLNLTASEWGDAVDLKIYLKGEFDVLQIYEGEQLTGDSFHMGGLLELGVKRYEKTLLREQPLRLKAAPYSKEKKVFLEQKIERDIVELSLFQWKPWYEKRLEFM